MAKKTDYYLWFVSIVNAVGFGLLLASATYVDALYVNPQYGVRNYPLGYSVLIFCLPVFYFTYRLGSIRTNLLRLRNEKYGSIVTQSVLIFLVRCSPAISLLWNFLPEFPHWGVLSASLKVGALTSIGMYLHNLRLHFDFNFVTDSSISVKARVESLKLWHAMWFDMLKILITGFVAIEGASLLSSYQLAFQFTGESRSAWFFAPIWLWLALQYRGLHLGNRWGNISGIVADSDATPEHKSRLKNALRPLLFVA